MMAPAMTRPTAEEIAIKQESQATKAASAPSTQLDIRPAWLGRVIEPIVDPDLPIIDAHHHLWDAPGRRYLFDEFLADLSTGHRIDATIHVQCHSMYRATGPEALKPVGETEFVAGMAARSESGQYGPARICAAIVGSLDPMLGDGADPVLEAHIRSGGGRFRGIRLRTAWDASEEVHRLPTPAGVLMDPRTRAAIRRIETFGLTLDVWCFQTQMAEVIDVCRAFPNLTTIINHIAGPIGIGPYRGRQDELFAAWSDGVRTLAALPNTFMKIGGLGMRFTGKDFHLGVDPPSSDRFSGVWRPYVDHCIQAFGPLRCMFESNFPVDKGMCSYPVLWNAYKKMSASYSTEERKAMLAGTAARVYRITLDNR
jgi:predicted TIM-barrel fold metal-dependent hydrolase